MANKVDEFVFDRGDKLKDKVTGFGGICISRCDHISGCNTYGLQPATLKDGVPQKPEWFDEPRLVLVKAEASAPVDTRQARTGADSTPQETRGIPR